MTKFEKKVEQGITSVIINFINVMLQMRVSPSGFEELLENMGKEYTDQYFKKYGKQD